MTTPRFLVTALLAGAFACAAAQEPSQQPWQVAGGASDPAAVKRVRESLAAPWKYKARRLSRAEVDALLAKPDAVVFIDLRRPDEFITYGSFPVFLSVQNKDLEKQLAWLPRDKTDRDGVQPRAARRRGGRSARGQGLQRGRRDRQPRSTRCRAARTSRTSRRRCAAPRRPRRRRAPERRGRT